MSLNTYDGLVSAIRALAEDESQEFLEFIPTAIWNAEENLIKKLDNDYLTSTVIVSGSAGDNIVTKPEGVRVQRDFFYETSSGIVQPTMRTDGFIRDYWPVGKTSTVDYPRGVPKYYGNLTGNTWIVAPTPVSAYNYTSKYVVQVPHLSSANQTNYFSFFCSDALFYGTMVGMAEFMKDYETLQIWTARYSDAVDSLNNESRRNRRDDNTDPQNPKSGENTINGEN